MHVHYHHPLIMEEVTLDSKVSFDNLINILGRAKLESADTMRLEVVAPFAAKPLNHEVCELRIDKKRTICSKIKQSRDVKRKSIVSYCT